MKKNILGPAVQKYCDEYLSIHHEPPMIQDIINHLNSLNIKFKETSIISMFSTWRAENGFAKKRGRQKQEKTLKDHVFEISDLILKTHPPELEDVLRELSSRNITFKETSIISMFSTWRAANGFAKKRGRQPQQDIEPKQEKVKDIHDLNISYLVKGDKRYEIVTIDEDLVVLKSSLGMEFETSLVKALRDGYEVIQ